MLPVRRHPEQCCGEGGVASYLPIQVVVVISAAVSVRRGNFPQLDPCPAFSWGHVPASKDTADNFGVRCDSVEGDGAIKGE